MCLAKPTQSKGVRAVLLPLTLCVAGAVEVAAESPSADRFSPEPLFERGRYELTLSGGVLFSPIGLPKNRPIINYTMTEISLGYMLGDVKGAGWWRGNFEALADGFGGAIFEGPGSYVAGFTLWLRYNLVPPSWRIVPYVQAGGGVLSTDIDRGLVGEPFNFNLDAGVGLRYFLSARWSLELEYRFQHISNADLGKKNVGINAQGPILGVSYFF
jgi:opacity protein-like surface antigen